MSYYGQANKKSIIHLLNNGLASLKDKTIEGDTPLDSLWKEYRQLERALYDEGVTLLSMTNKVKFENRLNTIRMKLEKKS